VSAYRPRVVVESDRTGQVSAALRDGVRRIIQEATFAVEAHAKNNVPVDTGNLKNSVSASFEAGGDRGVVATGVEYAAWVEYGTRFSPAQPYMLPAYNEIAPRVRADLDELGRSVS
jgi:HK97 gp10 family phage protein